MSHFVTRTVGAVFIYGNAIVLQKACKNYLGLLLKLFVLF